jgi:hypothetical protein
MKNGERVSPPAALNDFLQENTSNLTDAPLDGDAALVAENTKAIQALDDPESKVGGGWRVLERFEPWSYLLGQFRSLKNNSDIPPLD